MEESVRVLVEQRLDAYEKYREWIHHPFSGMLSKGYTIEQVSEADNHIESMLTFYEDLLDSL